MGVLRRFLNLIVDKRNIQGAKSLNRIDLTRHKLFNTRTPVLPPPSEGNISVSERPPPQDDRKNHKQVAAATASPSSITRKIREIQLPEPVMNFRCSVVDNSYWYMNCLPLAGRKLLCVDPSYRTVLFDVNTRQVETIPYFHVAKHAPLPCFVPLLPSSADADADADATDVDGDGNGSFYILEGRPYLEELQPHVDARQQQLSNQYEAFVYTSESKSWHRRLLPPPPFVCDPKHYENNTKRPEITSYAVVERGGGSHVVFVSADGDAGTYCLDTVTHTWSHVGDWALPFKGKVEYVPELKLWFGITEDEQLGAADLSTMDESSQPQLVSTWKELEEPEGWWQLSKPCPQLVSLGSGRFCITRFFVRALPNPLASVSDSDDNYSDWDDEVDLEYFTVLTGVDVVPCIHDVHGTASDTISGGNGGEGKVELQMIKHNSRRHISYGSDGNIEVVF